MRLTELLETFTPLKITGNPENVEVKGLAYHSGRVVSGDLFFCLKGNRQDGHDFAAMAVEQGAVALVAERPLAAPVPVIMVADTRRALSAASARFFGYPARSLQLIGVTGTDGKTTTTYYIHKVFSSAGKSSAILGTTGLRFQNTWKQLDLTTPQSLDIQKSLAHLRDHPAGIKYVAMEVSSHALIQKRVAHCEFQSAVFTNLSRDHLDYHGSMENYFAAKSLLFRLLKRDERSRAILNADDNFSPRLKKGMAVPVISYGINNTRAAVRAVNLEELDNGCFRFELSGWEEPVVATLKLPGLFNVYNALAAAAVARQYGLPGEAVSEGLSTLAAVPGRLEEIKAEGGFTVVIDFAHTPRSMEQVLKLLRRRPIRRLIVVFGCAGERDRGKRPLMGRIAERYSDLVILSADNPAGERVEDIICQIKAGMRTEPVVIPDRAEAVRFALSRAGPGDLVLLAGKGNEEYQLVGTRALPYRERQVVEDYLQRNC